MNSTTSSSSRPWSIASDRQVANASACPIAARTRLRARAPRRSPRHERVARRVEVARKREKWCATGVESASSR